MWAVPKHCLKKLKPGVASGIEQSRAHIRPNVELLTVVRSPRIQSSHDITFFG